MAAAAPDRLVGLGHRAAPGPRRSRSPTVDEVRELGLAGIEIGSNVLGTVTGAVRFLPFFQAAADAGLCVFVHAFHPPYWDCVRRPADGRGGQLPARDRHERGRDGGERLRRAEPRACASCASHGGGTLPLHLPRMQAFWDADPGPGRRGCSPYDSVRAMWFDSLTYAPAALARRSSTSSAPSASWSAPTHPFFAEPPGYVVDELHALEPLAPEVLDRDPHDQRGRVPRPPARTQRSQHDRAPTTDDRHDHDAAHDLRRRPRGRAARRLDQPPPREVARRVPARRRGGRQDRLALREEAEVARRARRSPVRSRVRQARPDRLPGALRGPAARVLPSPRRGCADLDVAGIERVAVLPVRSRASAVRSSPRRPTASSGSRACVRTTTG